MPNLWLPGVTRREIPRGSNDPFIIPVGDVFHVAVSESSSLWNIFTDGRGIESTGYIRRDGSIEQYRPLHIECDAQAGGNSWVGSNGKRYGLNSWETQGMGDGEWTDAQIATIKWIISLKHKEWGVPLRVCPSPHSSGFGYHRLFSSWNPNSHSCPGPDRVRQFENVIVPWMKAGAQEGDWFDMATQQDLEDAVAHALGGAPIRVGTKDGEPVFHRLSDVLRDLLNDEARIKSAIGNNADRIRDAILAKLTVSAAGDGTLTTAEVQDAVEAGLRDVLGSLDQ